MLTMIVNITDDNVRSEIEELYYLYKKNCFYEAYSIVKDIYKATDIVQITYQKLIEYLEFHTLDEIDNPKGFLVTISRRTALNEVKSYSNSKVIYTDKMETYYESTNEEPLTNIIKLEEASQLMKKLKKLKPEYAEIISLKYEGELSDDELGVILGISPVNTRMRLSRARKSYKKLLLGGSNHE